VLTQLPPLTESQSRDLVSTIQPPIQTHMVTAFEKVPDSKNASESRLRSRNRRIRVLPGLIIDLGRVRQFSITFIRAGSSRACWRTSSQLRRQINALAKLASVDLVNMTRLVAELRPAGRRTSCELIQKLLPFVVLFATKSGMTRSQIRR